MRVEVNSLRAIGNGLVEVAVLLIGKPSVTECSGRLRIETNCLRVVSNGLAELAVLRVDPAAIDIRIAFVWADTNSLVAIGNGPVEVAFLLVGNPSATECFGKLRVEANCLRVVSDGRV